HSEQRDENRKGRTGDPTQSVVGRTWTVIHTPYWNGVSPSWEAYHLMSGVWKADGSDDFARTEQNLHRAVHVNPSTWECGIVPRPRRTFDGKRGATDQACRAPAQAQPWFHPDGHRHAGSGNRSQHSHLLRGERAHAEEPALRETGADWHDLRARD